jgi:hypothetical protein
MFEGYAQPQVALYYNDLGKELHTIADRVGPLFVAIN